MQYSKLLSHLDIGDSTLRSPTPCLITGMSERCMASPDGSFSKSCAATCIAEMIVLSLKGKFRNATLSCCLAGAIATNELERAVDAVCCLGTAATVVEVVDACRERRLEMMVGVSGTMKDEMEVTNNIIIRNKRTSLTQGCEYLRSVEGVPCRWHSLLLRCRGLSLHLAPGRGSGSPESLIERIVTPALDVPAQ